MLAETRMFKKKSLQEYVQKYKDGHFLEVIRSVNGIETTDRKYGEAKFVQGKCFLELGLLQEAIKCFEEASISFDHEELRTWLICDEEPPSETISDIEFLEGVSLNSKDKWGLKNLLSTISNRLSSIYVNDNIIVFQRALTFLKKPDFMSAVRQASETGQSFRDRTWRAHTLCWAASNCISLEGDFVELGTFQGYFAQIICEVVNLSDKRFFLFDTFEGLPDGADLEPDLPNKFYEELNDHYRQKDLYKRVKEKFLNFPNVEVVAGEVPGTLTKLLKTKICFLHVDLNSATHELQALEHLWDCIVPGGHIILDDFGHAIFKTQTAYHQQFFEEKGQEILELPTGQGLVIKAFKKK